MACKHIANYTCAHESRSAMLGEDRFDYPENHIEADNRLSWLLGRLDKVYGDDAFYVHLKRGKDDTARSFTKRYSSGIIKAYRGDGILLGLPKDSDPMSVSLDYCDTVNSNIELFLKDKTRKTEVALEHIDRDFTKFWNLIGAEGDIGAALAELGTHYNATPQAPKSREKEREKLGLRVLRKLSRLILKLPNYIKSA